jgi:hypothetical protein
MMIIGWLFMVSELCEVIGSYVIKAKLLMLLYHAIIRAARLILPDSYCQTHTDKLMPKSKKRVVG